MDIAQTSFKLSPGVRQGCPLSPYLFIVSPGNLDLSVQYETRPKNKRNNNLSKRAEAKPVCRRHNSFIQRLQFSQWSYYGS